MSGVLHVRVRTPYEAECAEAGGADRLIVVSDTGLSPLPETVNKIRKASSVDLRVLLRLREGYTTDGGEMTRLKGLAFSYRGAGADGFVFGFLNDATGIDHPACEELAGDDTWYWTFDRAIDASLDPDRAWAEVASLPRVDSIMSAGSARDVEHGLDHLITHPDERLIVSGDLQPSHVPWLARAGFSQFYVDSTPVTADGVASWRRLIDHEMVRGYPRTRV